MLVYLKCGVNDIEGGSTSSVSSNAVRIDDVSFNAFVQTNEFDRRLLSLKPQDGEFTVMTYRLRGEQYNHRMPFKIQPYVNVLGKMKMEIVVKVR